MKKIKIDLTFVENEVYEKIDKLIRKRLPKNEEQAQSQPKDLNTSIPFKFI